MTGHGRPWPENVPPFGVLVEPASEAWLLYKRETAIWTHESYGVHMTHMGPYVPMGGIEAYMASMGTHGPIWAFYGLQMNVIWAPKRTHTGVCKKKAPPVTTTTQQGALLKAIKGPMICDFFPIKEKTVLVRFSQFLRPLSAENPVSETP